MTSCTSYVDPKQENKRRVVVPKQLRKQIMEENHSGPMAGHFSGNRMYNVLVRHWWWQGMYTDTFQHCKNGIPESMEHEMEWNEME